jgi:hypothetical protein
MTIRRIWHACGLQPCHALSTAKLDARNPTRELRRLSGAAAFNRLFKLDGILIDCQTAVSGLI